MSQKPRLLRITTASISLRLLLRGQFTFFQQQDFEVLTVSADGPEVKDILSDNIPHQVVPMTRAITPVQDLICLYKLILLIRSFKPDIVHTHTPKAGLLGMMAARIVGIKIRIHTVAGLPMMEARGLKRAVLKMTERITYACATGVYPNSLGLLQFMIKEFQIPGHVKHQFEMRNLKFEIIGKGSSNGIDSIWFSRTPELLEAARAIRARYHIPEQVIVFSFVGRVVRDKGVVELVEAVKRLSLTSEVRLLLIGPFEQELDPLPPEVMKFIQDSTCVVSAGFQEDVRPWLLASDIFVFPSYREGFPNVVMQAACMEVPCIVSDINGCNEMIEHNQSGLIVPPKDGQALYEAMQQLMLDKPKRIVFASKARAFVSSNFGQHYIWTEWLKEYHRLLQAR